MGSEFGRIWPGTYKLAALERQEKSPYACNRINIVTTLVPSFRLIFFILAGNKTNHKSWDEFEFRQDSITDFGVSCPWASEKIINNVVTTLAPSFLIGSSSFLQATRTSIKSQMGSKYGQIGLWTMELAARERLESQRLIIVEMLCPL